MLLRGDTQVYEEASNALRKFGKAAFPALVAALRESNIPSARARLVTVIATCKHPAAFDVLLEALNDPDPLVRPRVIEMLGTFKDRRAVDPLLALLDDSDPVTDSAVICTLGRLGDPRAVDPLLRLLRDHDVYGAQQHQYRSVVAALQAIAGFPNGFSGIVNQDLTSLMSLLDAGQIDQLAAGVDAMRANLQQFSDSFGSRSISGAGTADSWLQQMDVRRMYHQSQTKTSTLVDVLLEWLESADPITRSAAAVSLPWYADGRALDSLSRAMQDQDAQVRVAAIWAYSALATLLSYRE